MFCVYSSAGLINSLLTMGLSTKVEVQREQRLSEEEGMLEMDHDGVGGLANEEEGEKEVGEMKGKTLTLSAETKKKVWLLSGLFGVDNLAGGLVPVSVAPRLVMSSPADLGPIVQ